MKRAEIDWSAVGLVTLHAPVPLHAPLQPAKAEPVPAVCESENEVPEFSLTLHVLGQSMPTPVGLDATLPEPLPVNETVTRIVLGGGGGLAVLILA